MIKINIIFQWLVLVQLITIPMTSQAAPDADDSTSRPIWKSIPTPSDDYYKTPRSNAASNASGSSTANGSSKNDGFTPAPPAVGKLSARIITDSTSVAQGNPITFSIDSNQSDLRYYWISNGQKHSGATFTVNTQGLDAGKYRVRATVTNKDRKQAHASLNFQVTETDIHQNESGSDQPNESSNDKSTNDGKVLELPAVNVDSSNDQTTSTVDAEQDTGGIIEVPASSATSAESVTSSNNTSDHTKNTQSTSSNEHTSANSEDKTGDNKDTTSSSSSLSIIPSELTVAKGGVAVFRSNVSSANDYSFQWKFAGNRSTNEQFSVAANALEEGSYLVHLKVTDKKGVETKTQATLNIRAAVETTTTLVPDVTGTTLQVVKEKLKSAQLLLGKVTKKEVNTGVAVATVLEQQPEADSQQNKGSVVDVVIGIAIKPLKPLTVKIQPTSLVVEQDQPVEFSVVFIDPEIDSDLEFKWISADFNSVERVFTVDTKGLALGKYPVSLTVMNSQGKSISSEAMFEVTAKTTEVPTLTGMALNEANNLLSEAGLKLGDVQKRISDATESEVLEQSPAAGQRIAIGSVVNLTTAEANQKEITTIMLKADTNEVKVGQSVTFTTQLAPHPEGDDIHYVYSMNADKKANIQPVLQWTPENEGIYSVSVTAYNDKGLIAKSKSVSIDVSLAWELPVAKILPEVQVIQQGEKVEFVSTATYDLNSSLKYHWNSDTQHSGSKKQFMFDTSNIDPGSYNVTLDVTDDQGNISSVNAMLVVQASVGGVVSTSDVTHTSGEQATDNASEPTIQLSLSRHIVSVGTDVKIKAVSDRIMNAEMYYFEPGDDDNTQWLSSNEIVHTYNSFGTYLVRGAVKGGDKIYYTKTATIWVWSPLLLIFTAGLGLFAYILMWWWTKSIPKSSNKPKNNKQKVQAKDEIKPSSNDDHHLSLTSEMVEEQIPLYETPTTLEADKDDIVTDRKHKDESVTSVLKKAMIQFVLGVGISILVLYVILKSTHLI